jgi:ATPase family protein associated with various cellular activities (AAA)
MSSWWTYLDQLRVEASDGIDAGWASYALVRAAIAGGPPVRYSYPSGVLRGEFSALLARLTELGGRLIYERVPTIDYGRLGAVFVWDDAMVCAWGSRGDDWVDVEIACANAALMDRLLELATERLQERMRSGRLYALSATRNGFSLSHVGSGGMILERGNYDPAVLEAVDHIVADLACGDPCGRLIVFEGEPGTGKTFLVRGLLQTLQQALCVLVPPQLTSRLVAPEIISVLTSTRDSNGHDGPVVLVLEEADGCLVPRQSDNMDEIGTLLNFTDGILGRMLDLRIIATTNAKRVDMDKALLRPGRLCRRVEVTSLRAPQAREVLTRLGASGDLDDDRRYTLAEIYDRAQVAAGK